MNSDAKDGNDTSLHADGSWDSFLAKRAAALNKGSILADSRVYLSGPMDFVASRAEEKKSGWRNRIGQVLGGMGVTVYDPWYKPEVAGRPGYGREDEFSTAKRYDWDYENSEAGDQLRAELCSQFWPTLHTDLRMVDTSDFLVAYCPTNVYSVGTVHEIVMARLENKPVLFVTPHVEFPALGALRSHLEARGDTDGLQYVDELENQVPIHPNPKALPSMWYMALLDAHYFFDGFGFAAYADRFGWQPTELDQREQRNPPKRPLLPYLEQLNHSVPKRYDADRGEYVENPDWLVLRLPVSGEGVS